MEKSPSHNIYIYMYVFTHININTQIYRHIIKRTEVLLYEWD